MILDKQNMYSDDQAITTDAASTNVIDHGAAGTPKGTPVLRSGEPRQLYRDMGVGVVIPLLVQVTEAFASGGNPTLVVKLEADNDEAFGSATTVYTSGSFAKAALVAGARIPMMAVLPEGINERYTRLYYDVTADTTHVFTAGKITAGIVAGITAGQEAAAFRS